MYEHAFLLQHHKMCSFIFSAFVWNKNIINYHVTDGTQLVNKTFVFYDR